MKKVIRVSGYRGIGVCLTLCACLMFGYSQAYAEEEIGAVQKLWRKLFKKKASVGVETTKQQKTFVPITEEAGFQEDETLDKMTKKERMKKEAKDRWSMSMLEEDRAEDAENLREAEDLIKHVQELQAQRQIRENLENEKQIRENLENLKEQHRALRKP